MDILISPQNTACELGSESYSHQYFHQTFFLVMGQKKTKQKEYVFFLFEA